MVPPMIGRFLVRVVTSAAPVPLGVHPKSAITAKSTCSLSLVVKPVVSATRTSVLVTPAATMLLLEGEMVIFAPLPPTEKLFPEATIALRSSDQ